MSWERKKERWRTVQRDPNTPGGGKTADERRPEKGMPRQEEAGGEEHKEGKPDPWGPRALGGGTLMGALPGCCRFHSGRKPNSTLGAEHNLQREPCREQMQLHDWS